MDLGGIPYTYRAPCTLAFARSITEFHEHHCYIQADNEENHRGNPNYTMPTRWLYTTVFTYIGRTQK
jgi:hypothetical protein